MDLPGLRTPRRDQARAQALVALFEVGGRGLGPLKSWPGRAPTALPAASSHQSDVGGGRGLISCIVVSDSMSSSNAICAVSIGQRRAVRVADLDWQTLCTALAVCSVLFAQFVEQPRVLNGDDRLGGKVLDEL